MGQKLLDILTEREAEVLECFAQNGAGNIELARVLGVEEATVRTHIRHLLKKTKSSNRTELAISWWKEARNGSSGRGNAVVSSADS